MRSQTSQDENTFNVEGVPIPVVARCKLWVCGRLFAGTAGSNLVGAWVSVVSVVCCQVEVCLS
jgi:hypothetical protein